MGKGGVDNAEMGLVLADMYRQFGYEELALDLLSSIDEKGLVSLRARDYLLLGNLYFSSDPDGAESALLKAIELGPQNKNAYVRLVQLYKMNGQIEQAMKLLWDAEQLNDDTWKRVEIGKLNLELVGEEQVVPSQ